MICRAVLEQLAAGPCLLLGGWGRQSGLKELQQVGSGRELRHRAVS